METLISYYLVGLFIGSIITVFLEGVKSTKKGDALVETIASTLIAVLLVTAAGAIVMEGSKFINNLIGG